MDFTRKRYALAIDLGGTKTSFGIMEMKGDFIHIEKHPTPVQGPNKIEDFLLYHIRIITKKYESLKVEGIGIGTGGVVDPESGTIIHATPLLPGWQGTPIRKILEENFKIKAKVDNDGNMAALGEYLFGSGKGIQKLVFIAIGTGIGGGAIIDGRIFRGSRGAAANIGHMCIEKNGRSCNCGKKGCLEPYASGKAIEQAYAECVQKNTGNSAFHPPEAKEIFQLLKKGDPIAKEIVESALDYLAAGITNIIELFDPDVIILGGGVSESLAPMLNDLRSRVSISTGLFNQDKIILSSLGEKACLAGAGGAVFYADS